MAIERTPIHIFDQYSSFRNRRQPARASKSARWITLFRGLSLTRVRHTLLDSATLPGVAMGVDSGSVRHKRLAPQTVTRLLRSQYRPPRKISHLRPPYHPRLAPYGSWYGRWSEIGRRSRRTNVASPARSPTASAANRVAANTDTASRYRPLKGPRAQLSQVQWSDSTLSEKIRRPPCPATPRSPARRLYAILKPLKLHQDAAGIYYTCLAIYFHVTYARVSLPELLGNRGARQMSRRAVDGR